MVVALLLCAPAEAAAGTAFDRVLEDYKRDAEISPCRHSLRDLRVALRQVPSDIEEFAPDVPDAIREAIRFRERHRCPQNKH